MILVVGDRIYLKGVLVATIHPTADASTKTAFVEMVDLKDTLEQDPYCPNCEAEYERGYEDGQESKDA